MADGAQSVKLPEGFQLEGQLPPGFQLETAAPVQKKTTHGAGGSWDAPTDPTFEQYQKMNPEDQRAFDARIRSQRLRELPGQVGRFVGTGLQTGVSVATAPFDWVKAATQPAVPLSETEKQMGMRPATGPVSKFGSAVERQVFEPAFVGGKWWRQQFSDPKLRSTIVDRIFGIGPEAGGKGILPELGGTFAGGVAGGEVLSNLGVPARAIGTTTRGARAINEAVAKFGESPAEETAIRQKVDAFKQIKRFRDLPPAVNKLITYFDGLDEAKSELAKEPGGGLVEGETKPEMNFRDLRQMREALDQKIDWNAIGGKDRKMNKMMMDLRRTMDVEEYKTVYRSGGTSEVQKYGVGKKDYARGMKLVRGAEAAGKSIGGAAGALGGAFAAKEAGVAYPWVVGGGIGGAMGRYLGGKTLPAAVRAITEAGMPKETMSAVEQAASEIKTEHKASVERAKNFGQESPVEHALRRAGRDPGEAAEIARRVEENVQARKARGAPTKDPNRPASEIMEDAKAEYEKKYGKPRPNRESEMRLRHEEELAREKAKPMGEAHMAQHFEAWQEAQKSGGSLSEQLQKAAKIQKPQTNRVMVNVEGQDRMVTLTDAQMERWKAAEERYKTQREANEIAFKNDPTQRAAKQKALGMQWAAEKRQITGELTAKEQKAITQREATNYVGKSIKYKGQSGKVTGHAFGRVKIQLADGSNVNVKPEDLE